VSDTCATAPIVPFVNWKSCSRFPALVMVQHTVKRFLGFLPGRSEGYTFVLRIRRTVKVSNGTSFQKKSPQTLWHILKTAGPVYLLGHNKRKQKGAHDG